MMLKDIFRTTSEQGVTIMRMGLSELPNLLCLFSEQFRDCFASNEKVAASAANLSGSQTRGDVISAHFARSASHVRSGDFGEILTFSILEEENDSTQLTASKKWRWKGEPERSLCGTDVLLFVVGDVASSNDLLLSAEVKTSATRPSGSKFVEALADAKKDGVSRIASTLVWYRDKAVQNGDAALLNKVDRVIDSVDKGKLKKIKMAVVVTDQDFEDIHMAGITDLNANGIKLRLLSLEELKEVYESIYFNAEST